MDVIATHSNTDFDAFASMLAVRRLYPGAVVALSGSLNRNVREFYRLHADELDVVEAGRLDVDRIERLILIETLQPERLGELEAVARRPDVDVLAFDHHAGETTDWIRSENLVVSDDGALTTTLVGVLAERELPVSPLEATVFALGIHEDTGSLTYPGVTRRDADALAWCLRHGAQQDVVARYLHTPLGEGERALLDALLGSLETIEAGGFEILLAAVSWPTYVDGDLEPGSQARRPDRLPRARAPRRDGRAGVLCRSGPSGRARRRRRGPGARGRGPSAGGFGGLPRARSRMHAPPP